MEAGDSCVPQPFAGYRSRGEARHDALTATTQMLPQGISPQQEEGDAAVAVPCPANVTSLGTQTAACRLGPPCPLQRSEKSRLRREEAGIHKH